MDHVDPILTEIAYKKNVEDMRNLLTDSKHFDVTITVGEERFNAHKAILAGRSSYFAGMFGHETKERMDNHAVLHNIKPQVFKVILEYLYSGVILSIKDHALDLFATADMVCCG